MVEDMEEEVLDSAPKCRTDFSRDDKMEDAVAMWDKINRLWKDGELPTEMYHDNSLFTNGHLSNAKFALNYAKIDDATFYRYSRDDINKRTKIGSKLGRTSKIKTKQLELERDEKAKQDSYYYNQRIN